MDYPWSVLGIAPTGDEKAIRKAYAIRLRETRPDEDPAGFQALLQARDHALRVRLQLVDTAGESEALAEQTIPPSSAPVSLDGPSAQLHEQGSAASLETPETTSDGNADRTAADAANTREPIAAEPTRSPAGPHPNEDTLERFQLLLSASRVDLDPEPLKVFWAAVETVRDQAPLELSGLLTRMMLMRLVEDMYAHFGHLPDISIRPGDARFIGKDFLMPYAPILRAVEERFGFLRQDRILFASLDAGRASYLLAALTLTVGRPPADPSKPTPYYEVSLIDDIYLDLVFPKDSDIQAYCAAAHRRDRHPRSRTILGGLFPLPVALYYRLYGFAAIAALPLIGQAVGLLLWRADLAPEFHLIFFWLYVFFIVPTGLLIFKRMRVEAAARKIRRFSQKHDLVTVKKKLAVWGKPDWRSMWIGAAALLIVQLPTAYYYHPADGAPSYYGQVQANPGFLSRERTVGDQQGTSNLLLGGVIQDATPGLHSQHDLPDLHFSPSYCAATGLSTPCQSAGQPRSAEGRKAAR